MWLKNQVVTNNFSWSKTSICGSEQYRKITLLIKFIIAVGLLKLHCIALREKCPNTELFLVLFSCIRTEYGDLLINSPYSVGIQENTDSVFSPNTGTYGPEITPYMDTFHAVLLDLRRLKYDRFILQIQVSTLYPASIYSLQHDVNFLQVLFKQYPLEFIHLGMSEAFT